MPNDILQDIHTECANLNKRTHNLYADLLAKLPPACQAHPDNTNPFPFLSSCSRGVLQFLKALDSQLTVPLYMHLIPELTGLSYTQNQAGSETPLYTIFFFEIISYGFSNDQILQILADLNQCFPIVPYQYHSTLLKSMCQLVDISLFFPENPKRFAMVMSRRLHNLTAYLIKTHDLPALSNLGLIPSCSDPHMGGKQALFLATDSRQDPTPFLYKPRSMHPDFAITRALDLANKTALALQAGDPTFAFIPLPVPAISVGSQMVTFISRCRTFTAPAARQYYTQMGELVCLAHFLGITDLHQDNLIPAAEGPQITDGECAFDRKIMTSADCFQTLLRYAFSDDWSPEGLANALFEIEGQGLSTDNYKKYADAILAGYDAALEVCTAMHAAPAELQVIVRLIDQIRIVPFSTLQLKNCFYAIHHTGAALTAADFVNDPDLHNAVERLANDCLVNSHATLSLTSLFHAMNCSFENGDLPYFSLRRHAPKQVPPRFLPHNTTAGYLYCDNTLIGRCNRFGPAPDFAAALNLLPACRTQLQQWLTPAELAKSTLTCDAGTLQPEHTPTPQAESAVPASIADATQPAANPAAAQGSKKASPKKS